MRPGSDSAGITMLRYVLPSSTNKTSFIGGLQKDRMEGY